MEARGARGHRRGRLAVGQRCLVLCQRAHARRRRWLDLHL